MVKANKWRSRSAGAAPYEHTAKANVRGKHAQMNDLMNEEDRRALSLNKYEESMTLAELQDRIKRQPDHYKKEFKVHFGIFVEKLREFKQNPTSKETDFIDYLKFMAHVSSLQTIVLSKNDLTFVIFVILGLRRIQTVISTVPFH